MSEFIWSVSIVNVFWHKTKRICNILKLSKLTYNSPIDHAAVYKTKVADHKKNETFFTTKALAALFRFSGGLLTVNLQIFFIDKRKEDP